MHITKKSTIHTQVSERVFHRWIIHQIDLANYIGPRHHTLTTGLLDDGIILWELVSFLSKKQLPKINTTATSNKFHRGANLATTLTFLKEKEGLKIAACAHDITEHKAKYILSLIQLIITKYQIPRPVQSPERDGLEWLQKTTQIPNTSLTNIEPAHLFQLMKQLKPDIARPIDLAQAIEQGRKDFRIPDLIKPDELNFDSFVNLLYINYYRQLIENPPAFLKIVELPAPSPNPKPTTAPALAPANGAKPVLSAPKPVTTAPKPVTTAPKLVVASKPVPPIPISSKSVVTINLTLPTEASSEPSRAKSHSRHSDKKSRDKQPHKDREGSQKSSESKCRDHRRGDPSKELQVTTTEETLAKPIESCGLSAHSKKKPKFHSKSDPGENKSGLKAHSGPKKRLSDPINLSLSRTKQHALAPAADSPRFDKMFSKNYIFQQSMVCTTRAPVIKLVTYIDTLFINLPPCLFEQNSIMNVYVMDPQGNPISCVVNESLCIATFISSTTGRYTIKIGPDENHITEEIYFDVELPQTRFFEKIIPTVDPPLTYDSKSIVSGPENEVLESRIVRGRNGIWAIWLKPAEPGFYDCKVFDATESVLLWCQAFNLTASELPKRKTSKSPSNKQNSSSGISDLKPHLCLPPVTSSIGVSIFHAPLSGENAFFLRFVQDNVGPYSLGIQWKENQLAPFSLEFPKPHNLTIVFLNPVPEWEPEFSAHLVSPRGQIILGEIKKFENETQHTIFAIMFIVPSKDILKPHTFQMFHQGYPLLDHSCELN